MTPQMTLMERVRKELYRRAWRLQYRAKAARHREIPWRAESFAAPDFTAQADNRMLVRQLLQELPRDKGRVILYSLYIENETEVQIARKLNLSQQAVSKWKRKSLHRLCQKLSSPNG
ncbi:sigma-70 family RNA polymerase sigma factor [Paenibacillus dendritiformis]|uniref:sigma-70 family RNA polymerase sigma factor n=1 Tax=Paenibacillus dendritiformis TaxID=130049 RepID=UPI0030B8CBB2